MKDPHRKGFREEVFRIACNNLQSFFYRLSRSAHSIHYPAAVRVILTCLAALAGTVGLAVEARTQNLDSDRQALIAFYNATDGPNWDNTKENRNTWLSDKPLGEWHGVTVSDGRVTALSLVDNRLKGVIPPELGDLSHLEYLTLSHNLLTDSIPAELGDLSRLKWLWLDENLLTGSIPSELGNLSRLEWLTLSSNYLKGSIPPELGNLSDLENLSLSRNFLTGPIPRAFGNLSRLENLWLWNNELTNSIPPELGNLSRLELLWLFDNQLSGAIPPELGNLSHLEWLWLSDNQLTGPLPESFTGLGVLEYLYFNLNLGLCAQEGTAIRDWLNRVDYVRGPDCSPTVRLSVNPSRLVEGADPIPVTVTAVRTAVNSSTTVTLALGGSAQHGTERDYTLSGGLSLTIPANSTSGTTTLIVVPLADNEAEVDEIVIVEAEVDGRIEGSATLTLSDSAGASSSGKSTIFVPVILTSSGLNHAHFTSELTLTNRGNQQATLKFAYTAHQGGGSGTVSETLAAGRQKIVPDAINHLTILGLPIPGSGNRIGTLRVEAAESSEVGVTVRTTAQVLDGRAGLAYPGIAPEAGFEEAVYLCGLRQNSQDRSNVAFQNMGAAEAGSITLRMTVFAGEVANPRTPRVVKDVTLGPGGFRQYSGVLGDISNGYVKVERIEGTAPFYAYGIINDQVSSDGSFLIPVTASSLMGTQGQTLPVILETGIFTSELTVTNFSDVAKTLTFRFTAEAIQTPHKTATVKWTFQPGQQVIIPNVVDVMRKMGATGIGPSGQTFAGAMFATVTEGDMTGIAIGARISSPGGGGQYGVFYSAVPYGEAFGDSAWVYGLQQNEESRSNLTLINTGEIDSSPSVFQLDIYDGENGMLTNMVTGLIVPAGGWHQIDGILGNYAPGTPQGYVQISKISGNNPFLASGVIYDGGVPGQRSGDGAYLPARE